MELVIFDLDNTLIKGQSQKLFLSHVFKKGLMTRFFYIKLMLWFTLYKIGIIKNPKRAMEYAFSFLKDMNIDEFKKYINDFFEQRLKYYIFEEGIEIIKKHKNQNRKILVVSNAIEFIPQRVAQFLNIDYFIGTKLEKLNNKFTGKIKDDIIYGKNKVIAIKDFINNYNFSLDGSWGYSDHSSDLPFLEMVSHGVVVNPDNNLYKIAKQKNWQILKFKKTIS
jgi:HAD superfamily hydrolase (TIGR01490 family)